MSPLPPQKPPPPLPKHARKGQGTVSLSAPDPHTKASQMTAVISLEKLTLLFQLSKNIPGRSGYGQAALSLCQASTGPTHDRSPPCRPNLPHPQRCHRHRQRLHLRRRLHPLEPRNRPNPQPLLPQPPQPLAHSTIPTTAAHPGRAGVLHGSAIS